MVGMAGDDEADLDDEGERDWEWAYGNEEEGLGYEGDDGGDKVKDWGHDPAAESDYWSDEGG
jgi:hypothetical protein